MKDVTGCLTNDFGTRTNPRDNGRDDFGNMSAGSFNVGDCVTSVRSMSDMCVTVITPGEMWPTSESCTYIPGLY